MRRTFWPDHNVQPFSDPPPWLSGYTNFIRTGGELTKPEYEGMRSQFLAQARSGEPFFLELLEGLRLQLHPWKSTLEVEELVRPWMDEVMLARIHTDICPGAGAEAPDRFLGPYADLQLGPMIRLIAMAHMAFADSDAHPTPAANHWSIRQPRPDIATREGVFAIRDSPLSVWRVEARREKEVLLTGFLPLGDCLNQPGWVQLSHTAQLTVDAQEYLIGRVVRRGTPRLFGGIYLNNVDEGWLTERARRFTLEYRLTDRYGRLYDALRYHGHKLIRTLLTEKWELS